ncbi:MAG: hypothetical protein GY926_08415 [bacterium]|nr:hypothetical protein [bacterium]
MEVTPEEFAQFFEVVLPHLVERQRRVVVGAAAEVVQNKAAVAGASGMSRNTVIKAHGEVEAGIELSERLRAPGGGDKSLTEKQPGLMVALDELVHPETRRYPMSLLRWTSKSSTKLAGNCWNRVRRVVADHDTRHPRSNAPTPRIIPTSRPANPPKPPLTSHFFRGK